MITIEDLPLRPISLSAQQLTEVFGGGKSAGQTCTKDSDCNSGKCAIASRNVSYWGTYSQDTDAGFGAMAKRCHGGVAGGGGVGGGGGTG